MLRAERGELVGRAAVLQAATGIHVGQHDDLVGRQDLRGLRHERTPQNAITSASVACAFLRQIEAVADEIGQVLDFGLLVIMRQDDRVAFLAQAVDLGAQVETLSGSDAVPCVHDMALRRAAIKRLAPRDHADPAGGGAKSSGATSRPASPR